MWIVDAHRGDGKRYVVREDEKLIAFIELESAIRGLAFALTICRALSPSAPTQRPESGGRVKKALSRCFLPLFQTCTRGINYRENERKYL